MRVYFNEKLNTTLTMITWSFAYWAARKGPWEMYARDCQRFNYTRIRRYEPLFNTILEQQHRSRIFKERFEFV